MKKFTSLVLITFTLGLCMATMSCSKKDKPAKATTPAQILCEQFKKVVKADSSISLEDLAEKLITNEAIVFGPAVMPVEEGYLNGFTDEIKGFKEGVLFGPMIGSIPFIGYVFHTDDAAALTATLKEKADLRWNVCTQADEMVVESVKDTVFFVMAPMSFDEE